VSNQEIKRIWKLKLDLIGLGSAIIDFYPANLGVKLNEVDSFFPTPGGAVSNILVSASRLGLKTGFLGCIGKDQFGEFIIRNFKNEDVDISHIKQIDCRNTGISFYSVDDKGERHYLFFRFPGYTDPESMLTPSDIKEDYIASSRFFHFSESMLRKKNTRESIFESLRIAQKHDVQISYDPNIRISLWNENQEFLKCQKKVIRLVDIFTSTLEEAKILTGRRTSREIADKLLSLGPKIIVIRQKKKYFIKTATQKFILPIFNVTAVDTSGAGDVFNAGLLAGLVHKLSLDKAVLLGGAAASLKVTKAGTRAGLPLLNEVIRFIKKRTGVDYNLLI
jgi:sugar/nucleoside kinase (ribokinase family)